MIGRAVAGLLVASAVALAAQRAHALSLAGTIAAIVVGTVAVSAGWAWGTLLIAYFIVSLALSKLRGAEKATRTGDVVAKGGARDAVQVLANGGLFAVAAIVATLSTLSVSAAAIAIAAALGALAASAADTWATEIGSLASAPPRSIMTGRPVPPGTSGGVNLIGIAAMVAGGAFVAFGARALAIDAPVLAVTIGGVSGALADSVVGATMQDRRWCESCQASTERAVHSCGCTTRHSGGLSVMDNDMVNLIATLVGGAVAAILVSL
ncbi:MAG: protein of unknown function transrane [Gemmatimonadetes bacterium]|nr:protein of unknown function transrane [Gemmatimonadota bacterium]